VGSVTDATTLFEAADATTAHGAASLIGASQMNADPGARFHEAPGASVVADRVPLSAEKHGSFETPQTIRIRRP
jgi:hypothetical protein